MDVVNFKGVQFQSGQPMVRGAMTGTRLNMVVTDERHILPGNSVDKTEHVAGGFAGALNEALSRVERLDVDSQKLTVQSVVDPDSVDAHTVIVAAEKARFALNLTKALSDGFIRTFREVTNPR
jgi:flagellar hook-basal body complex protein FliE